MTEQQIKSLHRAIDLAKGPGNCHYEEDGKPCCVAAQLAALEGVSVDDLRLWDNAGSVSGDPINQIKALCRPGVDKLAGYDIHLVKRVQRVWDSGIDNGLIADQSIPEGIRRSTMHALVNEYASEEAQG